MIRDHRILPRYQIAGAVLWCAFPIIFVGADGTGKTTFCESIVPAGKMFHYTRDNAHKWLADDLVWAAEMDGYNLFDRHPVIDWPVYQYALGHMTEEEMYKFLDEERVWATLYDATVVWLRKSFVRPSLERGDLPEVVGLTDKVQEGYRLAFNHLATCPRMFNTTVLEEREDGI